jgi:hypothetical protein
MVNYICLYCKKNFGKKSNYCYHTNSCIKNFNKLIKMYKSYDVKEMLESFNKYINKKKYKCENCSKIFCSNYGFKKHMKKQNCELVSDNQENEKINKIIYNLRNNSAPINNINNTTNNIDNSTTNNIDNSTTNNIDNSTTNNITNNITNINLIPYDKIKYDINPATLKEAIEVPGKAFQTLTKYVFFDPEKKENHVIFCPNLKNTTIYVYNNDKLSEDGWSIINKKEFFKSMLCKQFQTLLILKDNNDKKQNKLKIKSFVGFNNLVNEFGKDDSIIKEQTEKLNSLCYQNKNIVKNTKNKTNK